MVSFINRDCMDDLPILPDNMYDLAIIDPMYGIKENAYRKVNDKDNLAVSKSDKNIHVWQYPPPEKEFFDQVRRISKNQIIWGGNYFTDYLPASRCWIVWNKVNQGTAFADFELAWTSFDKSSRMFNFMWSGMMQGSPENGSKMQGNKKLNEKRIHPCQKPVQLYRWTLQQFAQDGDLILDTHVGSGSSLIAAMEEGFTIHGYEIDEPIFLDATDRVREYQRVLKLKFK